VEEVMHALGSIEGGLNARLRSVKFALRPVRGGSAGLPSPTEGFLEFAKSEVFTRF